MLLGIEDNSQDSLLSFLIDDIVSMILSYCRIEVLPTQLIGLVPQIVMSQYRNRGYGGEETPMEVKSISQGDRSISFESKKASNDILNNYKSRLNPFINRKGRVPSELDDD